MKLQFAFGNPRHKKKRKSTHKKKFAKARKKPKTKKRAVKSSSKLSRKLRQAVQMAKSRRKSGKRKNPVLVQARKIKEGKKRLVGSAIFPLKHEYVKLIENDPNVLRFKKMLSKAKSAGEKNMLANKIVNLKKLKAQKYITDIQQKQKYMQRLEEEGAEIKYFISQGGKVGRKKSTGKAGKKADKKAGKKADKKAGKKADKKAGKKAGKKVTKKSTKRRYPKMIAHKHAKTTRHIKKGSTAKVSARKRKGSYKISTHFGKGKKRVKLTGRLRASKTGLKGTFKINPFRRNPLKNIAAQTKKYLGLDAAELTSLALGGALVPVTNGLVGKFAPKVASTISQYVGPQAAGSVLPILAGIALNAVAEHGVRSGQGHEYLKKPVKVWPQPV
ncbi:MAG: hypothetical protein HC883_00195 [Bdellovibrionaceae bacterium]|nr:hypothetical protein [Pseudobdellovibrionaceae bacterium]